MQQESTREAHYAGLTNPRRYRLSADQKAKISHAYLIEGKQPSVIARELGLPGDFTVKNFAVKSGLTKQRKRLEMRKAAATEKAVESVLAKVERRLAASTDNALAVFEDSLADAAQSLPGDRLEQLQEAKAALAIVNDVSGRDAAKSAAASGPILHLHAHAFLPRSVSQATDSSQVVDVPTVAPSET